MKAGPRKGHRRLSPLRSPFSEACAALAVAVSPGRTLSTIALPFSSVLVGSLMARLSSLGSLVLANVIMRIP
jgi:lipopolysaccharide export LptBFGC system permease protein LptF